MVPSLDRRIPYTIYKDGVGVSSGTWIAGAQLLGADLASLEPGTYKFTIFVDDGIGGTANETVIVEVKTGILGIETPWFVVIIAGGAVGIVVIGFSSARHKKIADSKFYRGLEIFTRLWIPRMLTWLFQCFRIHQ